MRRGVQRSIAERERLLRLYKSSGLTIPKFCKQEGVPESTFYQWVYNLRRQEAEARPRLVRVIRRVSVVPTEATAPAAKSPVVVEIGLARVSVSAGFDQATLASVLDVLGAQGCRPN